MFRVWTGQLLSASAPASFADGCGLKAEDKTDFNKNEHIRDIPTWHCFQCSSKAMITIEARST
jgi:hypothetical protein